MGKKYPNMDEIQLEVIPNEQKHKTSLYKATLWQNLYKALTGNRSTASTSSQIHLYFCVTICMLHLYPELSMTKMFSQRQIKVK